MLGLLGALEAIGVRKKKSIVAYLVDVIHLLPGQDGGGEEVDDERGHGHQTQTRHELWETRGGQQGDGEERGRSAP